MITDIQTTIIKGKGKEKNKNGKMVCGQTEKSSNSNLKSFYLIELSN
jgi:hypothetical protein